VAGDGAVTAGPAPHVEGGAFDVVVVGSGFGGSVAAYRFAEAGRSVLVLERGRAYPPGSFPRSPRGVGANVWDPARGLLGMFDVWSFRGLEALVASGLGGGSLIYANVLLRKDEAWFRQPVPDATGREEDWPVTRADLDPHYDAVLGMLRPELLPFDREGYGLAKTAALRDAAARLDRPWSLVPLAVRFESQEGPVPGGPLAPAPYGNLYGVPRRACRLIGECDIGCNEGAKNSLDHTYLSAAAHEGAVISPLSEVTELARAGDGFEVAYTARPQGEDGDPPPPVGVRVRARRVVLAAGTLGSTFLLLRNRERLPGLATAALGHRFCGNGDLLGLVHGADRILDSSHGPVITSAVRLPDRADTGREEDFGAYIEDAGYPAIAEWLAEYARTIPVLKRVLAVAWRRARVALTGRGPTNVSAELRNLIGGGASATATCLLGMGRDVPDGRLFLSEPDWLESDWTVETSMRYFRRVNAVMREIASAMGGRQRANPHWLLKRVITVHPLGGCPMADHPDAGVVDAYGGAHGVPGLFVADGSVMPGPVGPNPCLTIAAFADRMATRALEAPA
jgi:cholesterol oxidase